MANYTPSSELSTSMMLILIHGDMLRSAMFAYMLICFIFYIKPAAGYDHLAQLGEKNVKLQFEFKWQIEDYKSVQCRKEDTLIGTCTFLFGCAIESSSVGVFMMDSALDLTLINIYIVIYDTSKSGIYSCSKPNDAVVQTIDLRTQVNLTSLTLLPQTIDSYPVLNEQTPFTCITSPSRPAAGIIWFVADRNITDMASYTYSSDVATSILRYTPASITSEILTCKAYYLFKSTSITMTRWTKMTTQFPVSKPAISIYDRNVSETIIIREGRSVELRCATTSYPPPTYSWIYPGGTADGATVTVEFKRSANNATVSCLANNALYSLNGSRTAYSTTIQTVIRLTIAYPPIVQTMSNRSIEVNLNLTIVCTLSNIGNPPATNFKWTKLDNNIVIHVGQTLLLDRVQLTDEGVYQCSATNIIDANGNRTEHGSSQSQFFLDVKHEATIERFFANISNSNTIIVNQYQSVKLICEVAGDPKPDVYIINATGKVNVQLNGSSNSSHTYLSDLHRTRCEYDTGNYKCRTRNMFNPAEQEETINIIIQCSPRASPFAPPETTFYRAPYDKVQLLFVIKAYPEPSINNFTWSKKNYIKDVWETLFNESHYEIHVSYDRLQTALTIQTINVNDFGTYKINVVNTLGSINEVFVVQAQATPEIPQNVHVSQKGITELELQWIPGFNGGAEQTFQIRYGVINIESWNEIHAPANNTRHTLSGLSAGTAYRCKMRSENIYGISPWTEDITVYTLMENDAQRSTSSAVGGAVGGIIGCIAIIAVAIGVYRYRYHDLALTTSALWENARRSLQRKRRECETYDNLDTDTHTIRYYEDLGREKRNHADTSSGSYETYDFELLRANTYKTLTGVEMRELTGPPNDILQDSQALAKEETPPFSFEPKLIGEEGDYVNINLSGL